MFSKRIFVICYLYIAFILILSCFAGDGPFPRKLITDYNEIAALAQPNVVVESNSLNKFLFAFPMPDSNTYGNLYVCFQGDISQKQVEILSDGIRKSVSSVDAKTWKKLKEKDKIVTHYDGTVIFPDMRLAAVRIEAKKLGSLQASYFLAKFQTFMYSNKDFQN